MNVMTGPLYSIENRRKNSWSLGSKNPSMAWVTSFIWLLSAYRHQMLEPKMFKIEYFQIKHIPICMNTFKKYRLKF